MDAHLGFLYTCRVLSLSVEGNVLRSDSIFVCVLDFKGDIYLSILPSIYLLEMGRKNGERSSAQLDDD